jgi:hypothetical protein
MHAKRLYLQNYGVLFSLWTRRDEREVFILVDIC